MSDTCDPLDCSPPGSSVHGSLQARTLEWAAIALSRGSSPNPGIEPGSPAIQENSLLTEPPGKPLTDASNWSKAVGNGCWRLSFSAHRCQIKCQRQSFRWRREKSGFYCWVGPRGHTAGSYLEKAMCAYSERIVRSFIILEEERDRTGSISKAEPHLGPVCGLWRLCPVSMEMTYQLENQAPWMEEPQSLYLDSLSPKRIA